MPSLRRCVLPAVLLPVLAGCGSTTTCKMENPEYVNARERPRLEMPQGVSGSERLAGAVLVIPPVAPNPDKLDPAPRCLDEPPPYSRRSAAPEPQGEAPEPKAQ